MDKKPFSDRIDRISPSATLEMTAKAADLKRLNKPVYNMSVGEPDFPTPDNIQKAGIFACTALFFMWFRYFKNDCKIPKLKN